MRKLSLGATGRLLAGVFALALLAGVPVAAQDPGPRFGPWQQAVAVGPPITVADNYQACPFISKDGLDLYFRMYVYSDVTKAWHFDIFVSHRESEGAPWGTPVNLGPNVNTTSNELCSFVSIDGHWLYFVSFRQDIDPRGPASTSDIYVAHRKDKNDPAGWGTPMNLGSYVNTTANENGPSIFEHEATGEIEFYFTRAVGSVNKIFRSVMADKVSPGPATQVAALNATGASDWHAFVRRKDGLEVIFASNRDNGGGSATSDLYVSTRPNAAAAWGTPVRLGSEINSTRNEGRPSLSWDGTTLYFWTNREPDPDYPGYYRLDVYQATRDKVTGKK